jgi:hypothetical protein
MKEKKGKRKGRREETREGRSKLGKKGRKIR